jgi:predicted Zn-dependent protease
LTCPCRPNRRRLLGGLAALPLAGALAGCSENAATGRRQFVVVGEDQMAALAVDAWRDMRRQYPAARDPALTRRVETVGRRIADVSGLTDVEWEFVAFDSPESNAFVLPGGKVGVFRGLLDAARDDDELAAVIGHEVGHVAARHSAERLSQQLASQAVIGVVAAAVSGSGEYGQYADEVAAALGMGVTVGVILPYSRRHELEADDVGLRLADQAGYDPTAAVRFWTRRIAESAGDRAPPEFLSTHPADRERLERLRTAAAAL